MSNSQQNNEVVGIFTDARPLQLGMTTISFRFGTARAWKPFHPQQKYKLMNEMGVEELVELKREDRLNFLLQCDQGDPFPVRLNANSEDVQKNIHAEFTMLTILQRGGSVKGLLRIYFRRRVFDHHPILIINRKSKGYFYTLNKLSNFVPTWREDILWWLAFIVAIVCGYLLFASTHLSEQGLIKALIGIVTGAIVFYGIHQLFAAKVKNGREKDEAVLRAHITGLAEEYIQNLPNSN